MEKLGNLNIKFYQPNSEKSKIGLIGPIGLKTSPEEVKKLLEEAEYKISKVEILLIKSNNIPTGINKNN